jgi:hypothetical protein
MPNEDGIGRPLKFESVELLQNQIDSYFDKCDKKSEPYTITGLALALNTSRQTLQNYQKREDFFDTIEEAKLKVEHFCEVGSIKGDIGASIGQFILKNHGWKDKSEVEQTGEGNVLNLHFPKPREEK